MMRNGWALGWLTSLVVAVAVIGLGCGGGDGGGGVPQPQTGTATLRGTVVAADDTQTPLRNAVITVEQANRQGTSRQDGTFVITNLPAGTWRVTVETPESADYGTATALVPLVANRTTTVNFAVLPLGLAAPAQILLDPVSATIDLNGRIIYRTQLLGPSGQSLGAVQPTWVVVGGIGSISPDGVFSAEAVGSGQVIAYAGSAQSAGTVVVVAPRPPQINSFRVNPQTLPATGGEVFISAAVSDGDGIGANDVTVRIFPPVDNTIDLSMQVTNPGTALACEAAPNCYLDASFGTAFQVPANDNPPSADGVQAPENYRAQLVVRDRTGASAQSAFVDFVVQGIDQPPVRPPL
ncbi:MAG: carboxypeptidase-like regulatory domain-containing protein [Armatimonadota bacterium]